MMGTSFTIPDITSFIAGKLLYRNGTDYLLPPQPLHQLRQRRLQRVRPQLVQVQVPPLPHHRHQLVQV